MTQVYPAVLPAHVKVTDGTALANTTATNATAGVSTPAYEPDTWAEKAQAHAVGAPDYVHVTPMTLACNMPYPQT